MNKAAHTRRAYRFHKGSWDCPGTQMWLLRKEGPLIRLFNRVWRLEGGGLPKPELVMPTHLVDSCFTPGDNRIHITGPEQCNIVLLHEIAHALTPRGYDHGPAFRARNLDLLLKYSGDPPELIMNLAIGLGLK